MLHKFLFVSVIILLVQISSAVQNMTCAASHECDAKTSILTVTPVFSTAVSSLDEAIVVSSLRFTDSPMMRPAEFPTLSASVEEKNLAMLLSTESVEGFLSTEYQSDIGMF